MIARNTADFKETPDDSGVSAFSGAMLRYDSHKTPYKALTRQGLGEMSKTLRFKAVVCLVCVCGVCLRACAQVRVCEANITFIPEPVPVVA